MADKQPVDPVLRTKLYRPLLSPDLIPRLQLMTRLDELRSRPLTLVSAAAGYGKSTMASLWLEAWDGPYAWVSLGAEENDLRLFLNYLLAAISKTFPKACDTTLSLLQADKLPPDPVLCRYLLNDLDEIEDPFILVLDDYHKINEMAVHDMLAAFLNYPPQNMHLMILTRRDPPLLTSPLRARGQLNEITGRDLQFTAAETAEFLKNATGLSVSAKEAASIQDKLEGWPAGMRLMSQSLKYSGNLDHLMTSLKGGFAAIPDYLTQEVLSQQSTETANLMVATAIMDRFCAPLIDALIGPNVERGESGIDGAQLIAKLQKDNLFLIELDTANQWFRYHHLFQDLLLNQLANYSSAQEIAAFHSRACEWFEGQGFVEEALQHALAADDVERAAQIVERNWRTTADDGKWYVAAKWLSQIPDDVMQNRPELLLAHVYKLYHYMDIPAIMSTLDRIDKLLGGDTESHKLSGEVAVFRSFGLLVQNEVTRSLKLIESALDRVPVNFAQLRGIAESTFGFAGQLTGQIKRILKRLTEWLDGPSVLHPLRESIIALTASQTSLMDADPARAERYIQIQRRASKKKNLKNFLAWSEYLEGFVHLQRGKLDAAIQRLEDANNRKYYFYTPAAVDNLACLTLAYQAHGQPEQAERNLRSFSEYTSTLGPPFTAIADSCAARLAIMQGRPELAVRWLKTSASPPAELFPIFWFELRCNTWCRTLIAEGSAASLQEAAKRLSEYAAQHEARYNTFQLIGVLTLQAVALDKQGKPEIALAALERALVLAQPGGFIFPFLEFGPQMADLLRRLNKRNVAVDYVAQILAAFKADEGAVLPEAAVQPTQPNRPSMRVPPTPSQPLAEPLTNRELDVLELLVQRLSNQEIAGNLYISVTTVKAHLRNIYGKLNVSKRREAVETAKDFGIL